MLSCPLFLRLSNGNSVTNGAAVRLHGAWTPSPATGQSHELHVEVVEVLGQSDAKVVFRPVSFVFFLEHPLT